MYISENSNHSRNVELVEALKKKGATNSCARCGRTHFEIVGECAVPVTDTVNSNNKLASLFPQNVSTVVVACSYCGHLSHHAIGILFTEKKA